MVEGNSALTQKKVIKPNGESVNASHLDKMKVTRNDQQHDQVAGSSSKSKVPQVGVATEIKFSDVYAVELIHYGLIHGSNISNARKCLSGHDSEITALQVHGFQRSKTVPSLRVLVAYTFGRKDLQTCQMWVNQINASLALEQGETKESSGFNPIESNTLKKYRMKEHKEIDKDTLNPKQAINEHISTSRNITGHC
ncbi:hypothetical protein GBA52_006968 [Prunus armeniaca]|nr:hypothetical protein GBA52_006968 [Prunus armeniaca]